MNVNSSNAESTNLTFSQRNICNNDNNILQVSHKDNFTLDKLNEIIKQIDSIKDNQKSYNMGKIDKQRMFDLVEESLYRISWRVSEIPSSYKFGNIYVSKSIPERVWLLLDYLANTLTLIAKEDIKPKVLSTLLKGLDDLKSNFCLAIENLKNKTTKNKEGLNDYLESTVGYFFNKDLIEKSLDAISVITGSFTDEDNFFHNYINLVGLFRVLEILGECSKNITIFTEETLYLISNKEVDILRRLRSSLEHNQKKALCIAKNVKALQNKKMIIDIIEGIKFVYEKLKILKSLIEQFEINLIESKNFIQDLKLYLADQLDKKQCSTENLNDIFQPFVQLTRYLKQTGELSDSEKNDLLSYFQGNSELISEYLNGRLSLPNTPEELWEVVLSYIPEKSDLDQNKIRYDFYNAHRKIMGKKLTYEDYTELKQRIEASQEVSYEKIKNLLSNALTLDSTEKLNIHSLPAQLYLKKLPTTSEFCKILELLLKASLCSKKKRYEFLEILKIYEIHQYSMYNQPMKYIEYLKKEYKEKYSKLDRVTFYGCIIYGNKEFIKDLLEYIFERLPKKRPRNLILDFLEEEDPHKLDIVDTKNYDLESFKSLLNEYDISLKEDKILSMWKELCAKDELSDQNFKDLKEGLDTSSYKYDIGKLSDELINISSNVMKNSRNKLLKSIRAIKDPQQVNFSRLKKSLKNFISNNNNEEQIDEKLRELLTSSNEETKNKCINIIYQYTTKKMKKNKFMKKIYENLEKFSGSDSKEIPDINSEILGCPFLKEEDKEKCRGLIDNGNWNELEKKLEMLFKHEHLKENLQKLKEEYANTSGKDLHGFYNSVYQLSPFIHKYLESTKRKIEDTCKERKIKSLKKQLKKSSQNKLKNTITQFFIYALFNVDERRFEKQYPDQISEELFKKEIDAHLKLYKEIKKESRVIVENFFSESNTRNIGYHSKSLSIKSLSDKIKELEYVFSDSKIPKKISNFAAEYVIKDIGQKEAYTLVKDKASPNSNYPFISKRFFFLLYTYRKALAHYPIEIDEELLQYNIDQLVLDTDYRLNQLDVLQLENVSFEPSRCVSFDELEEKKLDIYVNVESLGFRNDFKIFGQLLWCDIGQQGDLNFIVERQTDYVQSHESTNQSALIELEIILSIVLNCNVKVYDKKSLEKRLGKKLSGSHLAELLNNSFTLKDIVRSNLFIKNYDDGSWSSITFENGQTIYSGEYKIRNIYRNIIKCIDIDKAQLNEFLSNSEQLKSLILAKFTAYINNSKEILELLFWCRHGCKPIANMEEVFIPYIRDSINNQIVYCQFKLFYDETYTFHVVESLPIEVSIDDYKKLDSVRQRFYRPKYDSDQVYQRYDIFFEKAFIDVEKGKQLPKTTINLLVKELVNFLMLYKKEIIIYLKKVPKLTRKRLFKASSMEHLRSDDKIKNGEVRNYMNAILEKNQLLKNIIEEKAKDYVNSLIRSIHSLNNIDIKGLLNRMQKEKELEEILCRFYWDNQRSLTFSFNSIDDNQRRLFLKVGMSHLMNIHISTIKQQGSESGMPNEITLAPIFIHSFQSFLCTFLISDGYREFVIAQAENKCDEEAIRKACSFLDSTSTLSNLRMMFMPICNSSIISKLIEIINSPTNLEQYKSQLKELAFEDLKNKIYYPESDCIIISVPSEKKEIMSYQFIPFKREIENEYEKEILKMRDTIYMRRDFHELFSDINFNLEEISIIDDKVLGFSNSEVYFIRQQILSKKTTRGRYVYNNCYTSIQELPRIIAESYEKMEIKSGGLSHNTCKLEKATNLEDLISTQSWVSLEEKEEYINKYKEDGGYARDNMLIVDYYEYYKYFNDLKAYKNQEAYYNEKLNNLKKQFEDPKSPDKIKTKLEEKIDYFKLLKCNNIETQKILFKKIKKSNFVKRRVESILIKDPNIFIDILNIIDPIKETLISKDIKDIVDIHRKQIALKAELEVLNSIEFLKYEHELSVRYQQIEDKLKEIEKKKKYYKAFLGHPVNEQQVTYMLNKLTSINFKAYINNTTNIDVYAVCKLENGDSLEYYKERYGLPFDKKKDNLGNNYLILEKVNSKEIRDLIYEKAMKNGKKY